MIPDTVAIVAWTVDTNLKPRREKRVTPNVTPEGPRSRGGGLGAVAPGELLALRRLHRARPESLVMARRCSAPAPRRGGRRLGWLCLALPPGDTAGGECVSRSRPFHSRGSAVTLPGSPRAEGGRAAPEHPCSANGYLPRRGSTAGQGLPTRGGLCLPTAPAPLVGGLSSGLPGVGAPPGCRLPAAGARCSWPARIAPALVPGPRPPRSGSPPAGPARTCR